MRLPGGERPVTLAVVSHLVTVDPMQRPNCLSVTVLGLLISSTDALAAPQSWAGIEDLGTLGGNNAAARGVSADGQVIVGWSETTSAAVPRACIWRLGVGMLELATFPGESIAYDVSADGSVVVGWTFSSASHAFRWTSATGVQDIGSLGGHAAEARGISADGAVIVGKCRHWDHT